MRRPNLRVHVLLYSLIHQPDSEGADGFPTLPPSEEGPPPTDEEQQQMARLWAEEEQQVS